MKKRCLAGIICLFVSAPVFPTSIYQCKTAKGVVFSQLPCAENAVRLDEKRSRSSQRPVKKWAGENQSEIDIEKFNRLPWSQEEVIAYVGRPAATYTHDGTDHWLYPNAVKVTDGQRLCPELLFEDGQRFQMNWIPEKIMKKSVVAARKISDWKQPYPTKQKSFFVTDSGVVGDSKSRVLQKLGKPDAKRVFNGREVWEYEKVRFSNTNNETLTIFLEFENGKVVSSAGN